MSTNAWVETLITSQVDGAALANSGSTTSILPGAAKYTLPSNYFGVIGKAIRITAFGRVSTVTGSAGNLTLAINFGTIASPIAVWSSGTIAMNNSAQTNVSWLLSLVLTGRAIGTGTIATLIGGGTFETFGVAATAGQNLVPASAPAVGTGFDSTITNTVDLTALWSFASASNSILCHEFVFESLN